MPTNRFARVAILALLILPSSVVPAFCRTPPSVSFIARRDYVVGLGSVDLATGDLNSDGNLDLLGNGDGTFQPQKQTSVANSTCRCLFQIFLVTSGLDPLVLGEPQIVAHVKMAWEQARTVGTAGRFLNTALEMALTVSEKVRTRRLLASGLPIPSAAQELACQIFGSLENRRVLLLGTGKTSALAVRQMVEHGAGSVVVIDQSATRARELAEKLGGRAALLADRLKCMLRADVVISATGCSHVVLTREEAERIAEDRNRVALVILDIGMPRDVDPEVRRVDGILLYDLEGLERAVTGRRVERSAAAAKAEEIVATEARAFCTKLKTQSVVPTSVALRQ